jgi:hypothetical protein
LRFNRPAACFPHIDRFSVAPGNDAGAIRRLVAVSTTQRGTALSVGVLFGSIAGFVLGMLFGKPLLALASVAIGLILRKSSAEKQRPKFEWLLQ